MIKSLRTADARTSTTKFQWIAALVLALLMTLIEGEWRWIASLGWILLAVLFTLNRHFVFYAMLFFAPWFHPTGYLTNLTFSLKHFQLAFILGLIVQLLQGNLYDYFLKGAKRAKYFVPLIAVLLIGLINYFRLNESIQALRTPGNIILTLFALFYLLSAWESFGSAQPQMLKNGLNFFLGSVVFQILVALQNTVAGTAILNLPLIHNNHIGILCAISFFYSLGLFLTEKKTNMFICLF